MGFTLKSVKRAQDQIEKTPQSNLELDHTMPNITHCPISCYFVYYICKTFKFPEKLEKFFKKKTYLRFHFVKTVLYTHILNAYLLN